jgi:hypothetical protein
VVTNRINDGNIFIFDRNGKALRKINRFGQGGEEYSYSTEIILDEDNGEMFVADAPAREILVYDLYGSFKRSFKFEDTGYYRFIYNYDRDNLICYKSYSPIDTEQACHLIISKKDGSVTREIKIPFKEVKTPIMIVNVEGNELHITFEFYLTVLHEGNWVLTHTSSDTVYRYLPDGHIIPFIVRTPSVHSMDPEVFLFPGVLADRYYFMQILKKEFDIERMKGSPQINLVYDRQEKAIFESTVYNGDYSDKKQVHMNSEPVNSEIAILQSLEAPDLVEAYGNGQLKGQLAEIAAGLDEESNPVIMLIKHRK